MGAARSLEPLRAIDFVIANNAAHALGKYLSTTARQGVNARSFQLGERLWNGELGPFRKVCDLHHGERLDVHLRKSFLQSGNQVEEVGEGQVGMQPANNVEFRDGFA